MAGVVVLQPTKVEMFEEVRPILPNCRRDRRVHKFSARTFGKARAERIIRESEHSRSAGSEFLWTSRQRVVEASSEEDTVGTRSAEKLFAHKKRRQRMEMLLRGGVVISLAPSMHVCV